MRFVIVGTRGPISRGLKKALSRHRLECPATDDMDVTDGDSVWQFLKRERPDAVINTGECGHPTSIYESALVWFRTNTLAARNLAQACAALGIRLVHISAGCLAIEHVQLQATQDSVQQAACQAGETLATSLCPDTLLIRLMSSHLVAFGGVAPQVRAAAALAVQIRDLLETNAGAGTYRATIDVTGASDVVFDTGHINGAAQRRQLAEWGDCIVNGRR